MLTWIKLAIRNLQKNRRRSLYTILAISLGFASVNVFGGFTEYIFENLKQSFIYADGNGHLSIFKEGFLNQGTIDPLKYIFSKEEVQVIQETCRKDSSVLVVTPQLHITGLISNGQVSTVFVGVGKIPSDLYFIQKRAGGMVGKLKHFDGKPLADDFPFGVALSKGLAEKLELKTGSSAIAMSPTVTGQINALDLQVFQLFNAPLEELNDKMIVVPLAFAQSLYDTTSVDRIRILLASDDITTQSRLRLADSLKRQGLAVDIRTWDELSVFYYKVKHMFDVIFIFVFIIVLIIAVMSVVNTVSMSIMERTKEIGTLRALGLKRKGVIKLFAVESTVLGITGCVLGLVVTTGAWIMIRLLKPTWIPPNIPHRVPLEIYMVPRYLFVSSVFLMVLAVVSAIIPARKAARRGIVDALGHV